MAAKKLPAKKISDPKPKPVNRTDANGRSGMGASQPRGISVAGQIVSAHKAGAKAAYAVGSSPINAADYLLRKATPLPDRKKNGPKLKYYPMPSKKK